MARRVLILSLREQQRGPARAAHYEFEDAVRAFEGADLACLEPRRQRGRLGRHASRFSARWRPANATSYDLVVFLCQSLKDLAQVGSPRRHLAPGGRAVCWMSEIWAQQIASRRGELRMLAAFDRIYLNYRDSVDPVAEATGRPVAFLPCGVDTTMFCPADLASPRVIDIYNMGRRDPKQHQALLRHARARDWFYLFTTFGGPAQLLDTAASHRAHLAELCQRSRYMLVHPAKFDVPDQTGGQMELGFRYFEALAAGARMLGTAPSWWRDVFVGHPDLITDLAPGADEGEVGAVLDTLEAAPAPDLRRLAVLEALGRHDWVHRWTSILDDLGLGPTPAMAHHQAELARRIQAIESVATA